MLAKLKSYPQLILAITKHEHRLSDSIEQFKTIAELTDGSRLHINEVWKDDKLHKYAYYQLTPSGQVINGWDNAPHHPEISTYPHHLHHAEQIVPSQVRSLTDVLEVLAEELID